MLKKLSVSEWMSKKVVVVEHTDNTRTAFNLLKTNHIRLLPVIKFGDLIGVVTDRDLRLPDGMIKPDTNCYHFEKALPITKVMTKDPAVLLPNDNLEAAATIMVNRKYGGFPVVEKVGSKKVVGVITSSDVMRALVHLIQEKKL